MIEQPSAGADTSRWQVYVCEDYGPVNPARVRHITGWGEMIEVVRHEIVLSGRNGQDAKTDAADLLDWLDGHFGTRDHSLRLTFFHVGPDAVCVQVRGLVGGAE